MTYDEVPDKDKYEQEWVQERKKIRKHRRPTGQLFFVVPTQNELTSSVTVIQTQGKRYQDSLKKSNTSVGPHGFNHGLS
jgi:hypothetical protein